MMKKSKIVNWFILILSVALIIVLSVLLRDHFFTSNEGISLFVTLLEAAGLVATIIIAISQLRDSKEISRADFIIELNRSFVENQDYKELYTAFQRCVDGQCPYKKDGVCTSADCMLKFDKIVISNYLTFFETIYILCKRGVVSFDIIDDLFAYRFFLAVHSRFVQREKLIPQPENFKNIFLLEKEWLEYRVKIGKNSKADLDAACEKYRGVLEKFHKDSSKKPIVKWKNVYEARLLKAIVPEKQYAEITRIK